MFLALSRPVMFEGGTLDLYWKHPWEAEANFPALPLYYLKCKAKCSSECVKNIPFKFRDPWAQRSLDSDVKHLLLFHSLILVGGQNRLRHLNGPNVPSPWGWQSISWVMFRDVAEPSRVSMWISTVCRKHRPRLPLPGEYSLRLLSNRNLLPSS